MEQAWLQVIGLTLDILGVLMVINEWRINFHHEIEIFRARLTPYRIKAIFNKYRHYYESDKEAEESLQAISKLFRVKEPRELLLQSKTLQDRKKFLFTGVALILIGFLLQIAGAWPGGIAHLGILP